MTAAPARDLTSAPPRSLWLGFAPFIALSVIHVGARAVGADDLAAPTKLTLMPLLALGALWGLRRNGSSGSASAAPSGSLSAAPSRSATAAPAGTATATPSGSLSAAPSGPALPAVLLFAALLFSWLGDGAGAFFPFAPELPVMLGCFGVAHICYIWLFLRYVADRPFPRWALVYPLWWVLMLVVLWPVLGSLSLAVAAYGIVLAGTAATAARCGAVVAAGGVLFLTSDTILSFRIFMPEAMPDWTSAMVMLTYCAGQGLIVAGVLRRRPGGRTAPAQAASGAGSDTRPGR